MKISKTNAVADANGVQCHVITVLLHGNVIAWHRHMPVTLHDDVISLYDACMAWWLHSIVSSQTQSLPGPGLAMDMLSLATAVT